MTYAYTIILLYYSNTVTQYNRDIAAYWFILSARSEYHQAGAVFWILASKAYKHRQFSLTTAPRPGKHHSPRQGHVFCQELKWNEGTHVLVWLRTWWLCRRTHAWPFSISFLVCIIKCSHLICFFLICYGLILLGVLAPFAERVISLFSRVLSRGLVNFKDMRITAPYKRQSRNDQHNHRKIVCVKREWHWDEYAMHVTNVMISCI